MNTDVFTLHEETNAKQAVNALKISVMQRFFYLYTLDDEGRLTVISLRELVITPAETKLKDIMSRQIHAIRPETDQEEVAKIVSQYNILAVPVIDSKTTAGNRYS